MERNILLTIEYDGSEFYGWQIQPDVRTVQGTLENVLSKFCGEKIKLNGASRTDTGVHALGQRASFRGDFGIPTERIALAVNHYLAGGMKTMNGVGPIRIADVKEVSLGFHARFNAKGKHYRYVINNSRQADVLRRKYAYYVREPLDCSKMEEAGSYIKGIHDFASFQSSGGQERVTTVRRIYDLRVERRGQDIVIDIFGDGFLYNMVRIIVGTLVEVGLGRKQPEELVEIIESRNRQKAGHTAPASGLYLMEVYYEETELG